MKTIKIGNVIFYKVCDTNDRRDDVWLTHDGEYGVFRTYSSKKKSDCTVAKNRIAYPVEDLLPNDIPQWHLEICTPVHFPNARSAMQYICENYYWESKN